MLSQTNKISDNGYIYKYNYKNSRKLLTFERDTTTISSESNETKSWSLGRKKRPIRHKAAQRAAQPFYSRTSNYTT